MPLQTYEAASVLINWNGIDLNDGIATDTFLTIEPLSDDIEFNFGADGKMAPSKMANKAIFNCNLRTFAGILTK